MSRVREDVCLDSSVVCEINAMERVECLGGGVCPNTGVERLHVQSRDGIRGWVSRKMIGCDEDYVEKLCPRQPVRVWVLSDVHTDRLSNAEWLEKHLGNEGHQNSFDVLLCAGDVSSKLERFRKTLELFANVFDLVVFTPGNHDGWIATNAERRRGQTTLGKFDEIRAICMSLNVRLGPVLVNNILILPLYSWYDAAFDHEPDLSAGDTADLRRRWIDYTYCKWGPEIEKQEGYHFDSDRGASEHISAHFAKANEKRIEAALSVVDGDDNKDVSVITMSHFVPRIELLPEKRFLVDPHLPKVSGSKRIEDQLRLVKSKVHVFGHTHIAMDLQVEGTRYVSWPLGSDRERTAQTRVVAGSGALLLYASSSTDKGAGGAQETATAEKSTGWTSNQWTFWSDYYRKYARDPTSTTLAPWVPKAYKNLGLAAGPEYSVLSSADVPQFPDNMPPDAFYRLNANNERKYRSSQRGDDLVELPK